MTWVGRFRRHENLLESLWGIPAMGAVLGGLLGAMVSLLDEHIEAPALWQYPPSTASTVLSSIIGATAALTGFVITVTVLVVQMATGTFSARILRLWFRDRLLKGTLALLAGTLTFSFSVLWRIQDDSVPDLGVTLAGLLIALCLLAFIAFFDRIIRRLRPAAVAADVARMARSTFAQTVRLADRPSVRWDYTTATESAPALVVRSSIGGAIQAVDLDGLVDWARAHDARLVLPHRVGDFVHSGGELARVYESNGGDQAVEDLKEMIALGDERTIDQDPAFALRIMVDIANRALSSAVNDPTTAVQVLDHIGEVLGFIGRTDLDKRTVPSDDTPAVVVMMTRRWEDYLTLGTTEIRGFGGTSIPIMRRLRALLEELLESVRPEHRPAVADELRRLDAVVADGWRDSVDLDRASASDAQGMG